MSMTSLRVGKRNAFTLVEILIVVVILGILAAVVVANFTDATDEARRGTASHELDKLRRAVEVYMVRNSNALPSVVAGDGTWGELVQAGAYLRDPPVNPWVGEPNARVIVIRDTADVGFQTDYGWIYDDVTGQIWAGGFDANDDPYAR